jgi:hypothetical protein
VIASQIVPDGYQLEALMHDATEAYIGDMVKPLKVMMPEFNKLEDSIYEVIACKFGFPVTKTIPVARADGILLATEARDLMTPSETIWGKWINQFPKLTSKIHPCSSFDAEWSFLNFFHMYTDGKFS